MINNLDVEDKILLTALIVSLKDKTQTFSRRELLASEFCPTEALSMLAIEHLLGSGVIDFASDPENEDISFKLNIQNNAENLIALINNLKDESELFNEKIRMLIRDVLAAECIEYIVSDLKKMDFEISSASKPPKKLLELLSTLTSSEVHMLLWQVIQNLSKSDLRILSVTKSGEEVISQIIDQACSVHLKYQRSDKKIKIFNRKPSRKYSAIQTILFTRHLDYGLDYFTDLRLGMANPK